MEILERKTAQNVPHISCYHANRRRRQQIVRAPRERSLSSSLPVSPHLCSGSGDLPRPEIRNRTAHTTDTRRCAYDDTSFSIPGMKKRYTRYAVPPSWAKKTLDDRIPGMHFLLRFEVRQQNHEQYLPPQRGKTSTAVVPNVSGALRLEQRVYHISSRDVMTKKGTGTTVYRSLGWQKKKYIFSREEGTKKVVYLLP